MCDIGTIIGKYHSEKPVTGYKVFSHATEEMCSFTIARGSVPRGEWRRYDNVNPYPRNQNGCSKYTKGFHVFVRSADADIIAERMEEVALPVQLKGDITISNQEGHEIMVGEWMYVPSVKELEAL